MEKVSTALNLLKLANNHLSSKDREYLPEEAKEVFSINFEDYTDDKEVLEILKEFGLYNPENMLKFLINSVFATLDSISSQIESIKKLQLDREFGTLRGIKNDIMYAEDNSDVKEKIYYLVQRKLFDLSGIFKEYLKSLIDAIRGIDGQSKLDFFIKAKTNETIINSNMKLIRLCIDSLESVTQIQVLIGKELDQNINSIILGYKDFYNRELLTGDTCRLLHDYEFKDLRSQNYFLNLPERVGNIEELSREYTQYKEEYVDYLDGYEDIIFEN